MDTVRPIFLAFLLLLACLPGRTAPAPLDLLGPDGWHLATPHPGDATFETVAAADAPGGGGQVLRVTVTRPADPFYMIQVIRGIPAAVPEGHRVRLHFWARSATKNPMRVTVEQNGPPYNAVGGADRHTDPQLEGVFG